MRFIESLAYLFGAVYYALYTAQSYSLDFAGQAKLPLFLAILALIALGHYKEGVRIHQVPFLFSLVLHSIFFYFINHFLLLALTILCLAFLLGSVLLQFLFGDSDMSRMKMTGPFEVGYKEFRSAILGSEVSVFYPIDRDHYKRHIGSSRGARNTHWLRHGDKTLLGVARASVPYGREDTLPWFVFRFMRRIKLMTLTDGDLAQFFTQSSLPGGSKVAITSKANNANKGMFDNMEVEASSSTGSHLLLPQKPQSLIPLFFSHGLSSHRTANSGVLRDLASHGYIVFSPDHMDLSSSYYETADGKGYYYCNKNDSHDLEFRQG
jgi:hypothetical protein